MNELLRKEFQALFIEKRMALQKFNEELSNDGYQDFLASWQDIYLRMSVLINNFNESEVPFIEYLEAALEVMTPAERIHFLKNLM